MTMEVFVSTHPESYFVIPMERIDSNRDRFVHASLTNDSAVEFSSVWSQFDEAGSKWMG